MYLLDSLLNASLIISCLRALHLFPIWNTSQLLQRYSTTCSAKIALSL